MVLKALLLFLTPIDLLLPTLMPDLLLSRRLVSRLVVALVVRRFRLYLVTLKVVVVVRMVMVV